MSQGKQESLTDTDSLRAHWTQDQRINAGQIAAQALNSPIFNVIHDMMMQQHFMEWQQTDPKEENLRRSLWYEQRALKSVMLTMASMVGEAQRIVAERQAENDPVEQERQRMDEQGYGLNFNQGESNG